MKRLLLTGWLVAIGALWCFFPPSPAKAFDAEGIRFFDSHIEIHSDSRLTVTEVIEVYAAGNHIKRGIFRDFPTRYRDHRGLTRQVGFEVMQILRDDEPEAFHIDDRGNGIRIYIGHKDRRISPGRHTYVIHYRTDRQIGFFDEFDELYWNVTGNGWVFAIAQAQATLELPAGAEILDAKAYTGPPGARGRNFTVDRDEWGNIRFRTQRPLAPSEGLTIAVAWPKGFVATPTLADKGRYLLRDNPGTAVALSGIIILLGYFLTAWFKVGRDPSKGPIIPLFTPPEGFSPAAVRFVVRMAFDHKAFAAAIVNMAVKGFVVIADEDGDYTLSRTAADESVLSAGEKRVAQKLFGRSTRITLDQSQHRKIKNALNALKISLKLDFEKIHFQHNAKWLLPGWVFSFITLAALVLSARNAGGALFMIVWLSGWTVGCFALVVNALQAWRGALASGRTFSRLKKTGAVGATLFALPFVGFEFFGLWALAGMTSPLATAALLVILFINLLFYHLIKAPTINGRGVMDRIEGFRLYLSVAEREGLNWRNPPEKTPALFEKWLPYALALDVENEWSEQFSAVLARAQAQRSYSPAWYTGRTLGRSGFAGLANSLGSSFSATISSSASPPGSRSGSSGGGSSGGGGGGGGGGGW